MQTGLKPPPKISTFLLELMLFYSIRDGALGDFEEQYHHIRSLKGRFYAGLWYRFQVLNMLPNFVIDLIYWSTSMFKSYLKSAMRTISRNKMTSAINIIGLSAAVSCAVFAFAFMDWQYSMDDFHENRNSVYLVCNYIDIPGEGEVLFGKAPAPLGPSLIADLPQIETAVRTFYQRTIFRYEGLEFEESVLFVDEDYLNILTFPLKYGSPDGLKDRNGIILNADIAEKYFGDTDPTGKQLYITFNRNKSEYLTVRGVAEKFPTNSSFSFRALVSSERLRELNEIDPDDWKVSTEGTLIKLADPINTEDLNTKMSGYIDIQNEADPDRKITRFHFEPISTLSMNSYKIRNDFAGGSHYMGRIMLAVIALLVLASACFNFINTAVASVSKRLKEIGVRKIVGSSRSQLIVQHIFENMLLCFIALILGLIWCETLFLPGFNSLAGEEILHVKYAGNFKLLAFAVTLLIITSLGAGGYPALFVSRLKPVEIIARKRQAGFRTTLSRISLSFQFFLSFFMVYTGVAFTLNYQYQKKHDWGYESRNVIAVPVNGSKHYELYAEALQSNPDIIGIAGTVQQVGLNLPETIKLFHADEEIEAGRMSVGPGFLDLMKIQLKEGSMFSEYTDTSSGNMVLVNELLIHELGMNNPVGKPIRFNNSEYIIAGVVHDFHYRILTQKIEPLIIGFAEKDDFRYLTVLTREGTVRSTNEFLKSTWNRLFPEIAFKQRFIADVEDDFHHQNRSDLKFFLVIAFINLAIASMGLLGLVSLNCAKKEKEISIRKVHGASLGNVIRILNREFLISFAIALAAAVPLSYMAIDALLSQFFSYRVALGFTASLTAGFLIIGTSVITIGGHVLRTAMLNPVDMLREE